VSYLLKPLPAPPNTKPHKAVAFYTAGHERRDGREAQRYSRQRARVAKPGNGGGLKIRSRRGPCVQIASLALCGHYGPSQTVREGPRSDLPSQIFSRPEAGDIRFKSKQYRGPDIRSRRVLVSAARRSLANERGQGSRSAGRERSERTASSSRGPCVQIEARPRFEHESRTLANEVSETVSHLFKSHPSHCVATTAPRKQCGKVHGAIFPRKPSPGQRPGTFASKSTTGGGLETPDSLSPPARRPGVASCGHRRGVASRSSPPVT